MDLNWLRIQKEDKQGDKAACQDEHNHWIKECYKFVQEFFK